MQSPIETLPVELLLQSLSHLRHHDLYNLMRVSRRYKEFIEPLLWRKIELHFPGFHTRYAQKELQEEEAAAGRPYHLFDSVSKYNPNDEYYYRDLFNAYHEKSALFLEPFQPFTKWGPARAVQLAELVRWLCIEIQEDTQFHRTGKKQEFWNALASFRNLEYLEVSAFAIPRETKSEIPFQHPAHSMDKLRTLRLRGFVPKEFVQYVCENAARITDLELSLIDEPVEGSLEPYLIALEQNGPIPIENSYSNSYEWVEGDSIWPRPLAALTPHLVSQLTCLSRLYLCMPSRVEGEDIFYSVDAENRIMSEWIGLLCACKQSLVHLILDLRPVAKETALDNSSNNEYMSDERRGAYADGFEHFEHFVLPVLLDEDPWPALRTIHLFGIDVPPRTRFPDVEIIVGLGKWMVGMHTGDGDIANGPDVLGADSVSDDEIISDDSWNRRWLLSDRK
ncbi:hypothetical protein BCR34DRAFT_115843 [Clohesyomyces aquaticus]|uniref:F-box domain-containing protein n=1 Tax=Clohesyomyces aquaticus TaxID=1231657 RepID=A0A1Y1YQE2_9PLEO|nr:hypothetical protein BCR34DRAFT_115843 [Clohesyomyces aquaticus]